MQVYMKEEEVALLELWRLRATPAAAVEARVVSGRPSIIIIVMKYLSVSNNMVMVTQR